MQRITKYRSIILFFILCIIVFFFRTYRLHDIPFGVNNDAAWEGSAAIDILRGNWQIYIPYAAEGWRGEPIIRIVVAVLNVFFGNTPISIHLASSVFGIALLVPLYFFTKELLGTRLAFLTTFFVATSGWHIVLSRSGWRAITVPLVATIALLYLLHAVKKRSLLLWGLTGVTTGLSLYTYDAGRIVPLGIAMTIIILCYKNFSTFSYKALIICAGAFILTSAPMLSYAKNNWTNFSGRSAFLFVGHAIGETKSLKPLAENIITTVGLFTRKANGNDFFIEEPLLDFPTNYLFLLGLILVGWHTFAKGSVTHRIILIWFISALIPAIASTPNGNRAIGTIPAVYIMAAIASDAVIRRLSTLLRRHRESITSFLWIMVVGCTCFVTYTKYFGPHRRQPQGFYPATYVTAHAVKPLLTQYELYFFDNFPHEILTYLLYQSGDPFEKNYTWYFDQLEKISTIAPRQGKGAAIVMFPSQKNRILAQTIQGKFDGTRIEVVPLVTDIFSEDAALIILIPAQETK